MHKGNELLRRDDLGERGFKSVVDNRTHVKFAVFEHCGDAPGDIGCRFESRRWLGSVLQSIDDALAELAAQHAIAFSADHQYFDLLAFIGQRTHSLAGPAGDIGVEAAAQAAVGGHHHDQMHIVLATAG